MNGCQLTIVPFLMDLVRNTVVPRKLKRHCRVTGVNTASGVVHCEIRDATQIKLSEGLHWCLRSHISQNEMVSTGDTEISLHIRSPRFWAYRGLGGGYSGVKIENTQSAKICLNFNFRGGVKKTQSAKI